MCEGESTRCFHPLVYHISGDIRTCQRRAKLFILTVDKSE